PPLSLLDALHPPNTPSFPTRRSSDLEKTGAFTLANYAAAYGRDRYVQALFNSLELGACAALLAGVFAVPLAWAVSRTDMPGRGLDRKSTRLNSSHLGISYAVFCLKKK